MPGGQRSLRPRPTQSATPSTSYRAPSAPDLIDLGDALTMPTALRGESSNAYASEPPNNRPPLVAVSTNQPDPAKRWTFHYDPCGCSATRGVEYPPTIFRCPICGGQSTPKFMEYMGVVTKYEPLGRSTFGRNATTTRNSTAQNLTAPIPPLSQIPMVPERRSNGAAASNARPTLTPTATATVPPASSVGDIRLRRAPSLKEQPTPSSPSTETSTPRKPRPMSIATDHAFDHPTSPSSGRAPRHPDLASAFKRGVTEEDERPPFSRQASANEGPSAGEDDRTNRDALAALDPFRPEPYSAISEVPKDGWEMNMDIDPKTPRLEQEEPELIERPMSLMSIDQPGNYEDPNGGQASDSESFYELPEFPQNPSPTEITASSPSKSGRWPMTLLRGKGKAPEMSEIQRLSSGVFSQAPRYPMEDLGPAPSAAAPRKDVGGPRQAPWKTAPSAVTSRQQNRMLEPLPTAPSAGGDSGDDDLPPIPRSGAWNGSSASPPQNLGPFRDPSPHLTPQASPRPPGSFLPPRYSGQFMLFEQAGRPHFKLTNKATIPVTYEDMTYPTAEHLFNALKFLPHRPLLAEHIRVCGPNPAEEAKRFVHEWRDDWADTCLDEMFEVLLQKFDQHPELKEDLLDTGEKELILVSKDDTWGIGDDKQGKNGFGKALMALRARVLEQLH